MKKALILLLAVAMLLINTACEEGQPTGPASPLPTTAVQPSGAGGEEVIGTDEPSGDPGPTADPEPDRAFAEAIDVSQYSNPEAPSVAMSALLMQEGELSNIMVEDYLTFHTALCDMATSDTALLEKIMDMSVEQQQENFYSVTLSAEGTAQVETDINAIYEALKGRLSAEADKYFQIESEFSQDAIIVDGQLMQSWDYLGEYMMRYYDYLYTDNATFRRVPALRKYSQAYDVYTGATQLSKTPSIQSGELIYQLRDSYEEFLKKYPNSPLSEDISKLSDTWKASNYKVTDDIEQLINTQSESVTRDIQKNYSGK